jgi:ribosomal protein S3AE
MAERRKYIGVEVPFTHSEMRVLGTPEQLHNKTITLDMTRKMRGKGLTVTLRILNKEGKLYAFPNKLELTKTYIRRMMRKRTDYVEDSFKAKTQDLNVTIKPLLITRKRVSRAVRKNLRNTSKEFLLEYIKEKTYYELCQELMNGTLQKALLPKLKKVYPLSFCDLRVFQTKELEQLNVEKILEEIQKEQIEIEQENTDEEQEETNTEETKEKTVEETNTEETKEKTTKVAKKKTTKKKEKKEETTEETVEKKDD